MVKMASNAAGRTPYALEAVMPFPEVAGDMVFIVIRGGAASLVSKPENTRVFIRDYDVDGVDGSVLLRDNDGDLFQEIEL